MVFFLYILQKHGLGDCFFTYVCISLHFCMCISRSIFQSSEHFLCLRRNRRPSHATGGSKTGRVHHPSGAGILQNRMDTIQNHPDAGEGLTQNYVHSPNILLQCPNHMQTQHNLEKVTEGTVFVRNWLNVCSL